MTESSHMNYAVLGNGQIAALIDDSANIAWLCLPRLDGDPVFNTLLSGKGRFSIALENQTGITQSYIRNTAILETVLTDASGGSVRITDTIPKFVKAGRDFRPIALSRRIETLSGTPLVKIVCQPAFDWNTDIPSPERGSSHARFEHPSAGFRITTNAPLAFLLDGTPFVPETDIAIILTPDETLNSEPLALAREWEEETTAFWRHWVKGLSIPLDYQQAVIRAAITLKLCVYEETGGIVAALTTSLPESPQSERNWDYRYGWVRDSYFSVTSLARLSDISTRSHYASWLLSIVAGRADENIQPLFGIGLETEITERFAEALPGFEGSPEELRGPVRVGNAAYDQHQHDVYGQIILGLAQGFFDERRDHLFGEAEFALLEQVGETALRVWDQPDAGIWEYRGIANVHTSSAMFCWAGCDRLALIAAHLGEDDRANYWRHAANDMRDTLLERAWNPERKALTAAFGGQDLDASLLLLAQLGMVANDHPKFVATVERIDTELRRGNHVFRYVAADDFGEPEMAFTACTFWHVDALHRIGRIEDAREVFQTLLDSRNAFGLLSEDIDPETGALWGNYPQTYCLSGIIDCALRLSRPWNTVL